MLTYHLDAQSGVPLYEQLYRAVRADIMSGALAGGTRLPSKRQLAANLRISQITVETAYGQLAAEGYIVSAPRRGYFVQEQIAPPPSVHTETVHRTVGKYPRNERYDYDFKTNIVDNGCFPFSTWAHLSRRVLSEYSARLLEATDPRGVLQLRQEIAHYLHDFRGIAVSPENIVVGAGLEYLIGLLIQLLGHGHVYAVENPGYRKLAQIVTQNSAALRPIPLDKSGLRADVLAESDTSVVYLTPSHSSSARHGHAGRAPSRAAALGGGGKRGRYIIEDDYDSEFRYASRPIPALRELDREGRVIYVNTFSKSLAPGLRIGYLVLPDALMARYRERFSLYAATVSSFDQFTLAAFMHSWRLRAPHQPQPQGLSGAARRADGGDRPRIYRAAARDLALRGRSAPAAPYAQRYAGTRTCRAREGRRCARLCAFCVLYAACAPAARNARARLCRHDRRADRRGGRASAESMDEGNVINFS